MSFRSRVSRRFHLYSSQHTALIGDAAHSRCPVYRNSRCFTCLSDCPGARQRVCPLTHAPHVSRPPPEGAAATVLDCNAQDLLQTLPRGVPVHRVAQPRASTSATTQQQLYELVKRTRTEGETEDDRERTRALATALFSSILTEASWPASHEASHGGSTIDDALMNAFAPLLRSAGPSTVPLLVGSMWLTTATAATPRAVSASVTVRPSSVINTFFSPPPACTLSAQVCRWHPAVPLRLVKACLQSLAHAVRAKRGAGQTLSATTLSDVHDTVRRTVPFPTRHYIAEGGERDDNALLEELAVLAMTALKGAPCTLLTQLYAYLEERQLCTVAVTNKFLASCGWALSTAVPSRGQVLLSEAEVAVILRAVRQLIAAADNDHLEATQEGLIYCVPALVAAGRSAEVAELYSRLPALRETPQSVMARVHLNNVRGAVQAMARLGESRPEGWVAVSPTVLQTLSAVARFIGLQGAAEEVSAFYTAVVSFHNASMIIGQLIEDILAGLCARIADLPRRLGSLETVPPRQVLEQVLPTLRAVLRYVGDELNTDILFGLIEVALQLEFMAVPLTTAIVWCLSQSDALSTRVLFQRVDASTAGMPFLQYYALCYARDLGDRDAHDHLAAVWRVRGDTVWLRASQLDTPYKLWKCSSCGRLNSDRFNYCLCSSLRYGFVVCARCGHGQDERVCLCRRCGAALQESNTYTAISRVAWRCSACECANPARQTTLCLRCRKPTGPVASASLRAMASGVGPESPPLGDGCTCGGSASVAPYARLVGCCVGCGQFATPYAASHSTVWRCPGCQQRRSSLERSCPDCPQVEYLPAFVEGTVTQLGGASRCCLDCGAGVSNVFATHCPACGAAETSLVRSPHRTAGSSTSTPESVTDVSTTPNTASTVGDAPRHFLVCPQCLHMNPTETAVDVVEGLSSHQRQQQCCCECGAALLADDAHTLTSRDRCCSHCRSVLPAAYTGAVCTGCAAFVRPQTSVAWAAPAILSTVSTLLALATRSSPAPMASSPGTCFQETSSQAVAASLERHRLLEETLVELRSEWMSPSDESPTTCAHAPSLDALPVAELASVRVEAATNLSQLAAALGPFIRTDTHARRCVALVKQLLEMMDRRCGVPFSTHFAAEEVCHECLGQHPPELCPYERALDPTPTVWHCEECGMAHRNTDVGRYLCRHCLSLRPVVQAMLIAECWQCARCARANVSFETYCIHCGQGRPSAAVSPTTLAEEAAGTDEAAVVAAAAQRNHIPFLPTKCTSCGLVYLEMRCPLCYPRDAEGEDTAPATVVRAHDGGGSLTPHAHLRREKEESGIVCMVRPHYAFIQPSGTTEPEQRVRIGARLLAQTPLSVGRAVTFVAEDEQRDGRRRVVSLKPQ